MQVGVSSVLLITTLDNGAIEYSTSSSLGNACLVWKAGLLLYRALKQLFHPYIHPMSKHMTSFTRPSSPLVLQVANTGVRKPGYKGTTRKQSMKRSPRFIARRQASPRWSRHMTLLATSFLTSCFLCLSTDDSKSKSRSIIGCAWWPTRCTLHRSVHDMHYRGSCWVYVLRHNICRVIYNTIIVY